MKEKINSIIISLYLIIFLILNILFKDNDISLTDRRKLKQFPKLNYSFTDNFESYALDQFAFRDQFRSIKTTFNLDVLNNMDNNKLVLKNNVIYRLEYPLNEKSVNNFIKMIDLINKDLKNNKVYVSVIPDKSYFLSNVYLKIDYNYLFSTISEIDNIKYIPLNDILKITDYYKTDTHWKQSSLIKIIDRLSSYMDFKYTNDYVINKYEPFRGVYYGQLGLNIKADILEYLTNDNLLNSKVDDLERPNDKQVYNLSKLDTFEPYDVYLNGSTPLISITNDNSSSERELIVFRDSFGSSLAPLLINSYKKITLVDLRYIDYNVLHDYLKIDKQDVLFLYSTLIINNSSTLKY